MAIESIEPALTTGPVDAAAEAVPPTPLEFRRAMGRFASGVTVVTGIDEGEPVGLACQSFASVSLEPRLVQFCASNRGRRWPRTWKSGSLCVYVMVRDQVLRC